MIQLKGNNRLGWNDYFFQMCDLVASRSTCLRRQVGAVAIKDKRIIASGYNGPPSGFHHCQTCRREQAGIPTGQGLDNCFANHAEENIVTQCASFGISLSDAIVYVTIQPCSRCLKLLMSSGVSEIRYNGEYPGDQMFKEILSSAPNYKGPTTHNGYTSIWRV